MRTGQTIASFASGSQLHYINIGSVIINSNVFKSSTLQSGVPVYELFKVASLRLTYYPAIVLPVSGTFEPSAFDFRYIAAYSTDGQLPSTYYANYNVAQMSVLLAQTNRPQTVSIPLPREYLPNEQNRQCIGQLTNAFNFTNYGDQYGGIVTLIQTIPSLNSITAYNPKLGYLECKIVLNCYNNIV
jgi:hypothetical protein